MRRGALMQRLQSAVLTASEEAAHGDAIQREGDVADIEATLESIRDGHGQPIEMANVRNWSVTIPTAVFSSDIRTCGLWHLDGDADDASDRMNDGTVAGVYSWGAGHFSQALLLTNARLTVPHDTTLNVGKHMTFRAWVYISAVPGTIAERDGWRLWVDAASRLNFTVGVETVRSTATITADTWTHVLAQFGNSELWVAVGDVVRRQATTITEIADADAALYIGNNAANNSPLQGGIDEVWFVDQVRFWSDACRKRAHSAVLDAAVYNLEENTGSTAYNSRLGQATLGLSGTAWATGYTGYGLEFNGISSWAVAELATFTQDTVSVGGWFKFDSDTGTQVLFDQAAGVGMRYSGTHIKLPFVGITNLNSNVAKWSPTTGTWYEIYGSFDGTVKAVWIDGQKWGELAATGTPAITGDLYVGVSTGLANYFDGVADDLVVARYVKRPYRRPVPFFVCYQRGLRFWEDWQVG